MANFDELFEQMQRDEYEDAVTLTPIEYAKLRGLYPQRVYAAIRHKKLEPKRCLCGRKVVIVDDADKVFKLGAYREQGAVETVQEEAEVPRSNLDAVD